MDEDAQASHGQALGNIHDGGGHKGHLFEDKPSALPLSVGLSVCEFIEDKYGIRTTLKWPNDILFAAKKLVGVLVESTHASDGWGTFL